LAQAHSILDRRRAGILLHITSLPGAADNGDLGKDAYRFADFLAREIPAVRAYAQELLQHSPYRDEVTPDAPAVAGSA